MSANRRQHYLPQVYQKQFCPDQKKPWYIEKGQTEATNEKTTKGIGWESFHLSYRQSGKRHNDSKDVPLKALENEYLNQLNRLLLLQKNDPIPNELRDFFLEWVAIHCVRNLSTKEWLENRFREAESEVKPIIKEEVLARHPSAPEEVIESLIESSLQKQYEEDIKSNREYIETMDETVPEIKSHLSTYQIALYDAPKGTAFVTSDMPVYMSGDPLHVFILPLNPKTALVSTPAEQANAFLSRIKATEGQVRLFNKVQAHFCHTFIIGHDKNLVETTMLQR